MPHRRNASAWQREQTAALWRTITVMIVVAVVGVALLVLLVEVLS
jgi:hypothetical protein